jgi:hypothetical protein
LQTKRFVKVTSDGLARAEVGMSILHSRRATTAIQKINTNARGPQNVTASIRSAARLFGFFESGPGG